MDVHLHYKRLWTTGDPAVIAERALEEFPLRVLPVFVPWFPSSRDASLPIRPKKSPPVISSHSGGVVSRPDSAVPAPRGVLDIRVPKVTSNGAEIWNGPSENVETKCWRSWCVFIQRRTSHKTTRPMSDRFLRTVHKHGLDLHQRVRWVVCEWNCDSRDLEATWSRLSHAIKHARLPTCNANHRRTLKQIWVFCDVWCSEHVGHYMLKNFGLSGALSLSVHRIGDIFKLRGNEQ